MFNKTSKGNAKLGLVTSFSHQFLLNSFSGITSNANIFQPFSIFQPFTHFRELRYNTQITLIRETFLSALSILFSIMLAGTYPGSI